LTCVFDIENKDSKLFRHKEIYFHLGFLSEFNRNIKVLDELEVITSPHLAEIRIGYIRKARNMNGECHTISTTEVDDAHGVVIIPLIIKMYKLIELSLVEIDIPPFMVGYLWDGCNGDRAHDV
jgi:hypothetical protein